MRADLKGYLSWEAPASNVNEFAPEDPTYFSIELQTYIGIDNGSKASDNFTFSVCTQRWLAENLPRDARWPRRSDSLIFPRGLIIVPHWDLEVILQAVTDLCEQIEGDDWPTIARQLNRYSIWEYEYRDDRGDF